MKKIIEDPKQKMSNRELVRRGFVSGVGWAFGATLGFAVISTILVFVLRQLGGIPLVGGWIALIVQSTLDQLVQNTPIFTN
jgi:hypothetical protein